MPRAREPPGPTPTERRITTERMHRLMATAPQISVNGKRAGDETRRELETLEAEVADLAQELAEVEWRVARQGHWLNAHPDHPRFEERRAIYHQNLARQLDYLCALDARALRANRLSETLLDHDAAYTCEDVIRVRWQAVTETEPPAPPIELGAGGRKWK